MAEIVKPPEDDNKPPPSSDELLEAQLKILKTATAFLMEHFDTVQIFVTRHVSGDAGTEGLKYGEGNFYARFGQVQTWLTQQDQGTRNGD